MTTLSKSNLELVSHAKMALAEKWGYVYGTYGLALTEKILQDKLKQYPDNVKQYESFIRQNWVGKRTADCVGLIKSYLWWNGSNPTYDSKTDVSANGMYSKAIEKGSFSTLLEVPGTCLWKNGHIGIYIGSGQVIEAHGTKYGVIQTPLKGTGATAWTNWLKCPYIDYAKEDKAMGKAFKDVADDRWSAKEIAAAKELGLITGNADGTFNPEGPSTREQAVVMHMRMYEIITGKKVV